MLKIIFGYGIDDEVAIGHALDEYNSVEGRKTYHESKVRQLTDGSFRCEIWYTLTQDSYIAQQPKHEFIGSTDIDPNDPDWHAKWKALQDESNAQDQLDQETEDSTKTDTMNHIADH